MDLTSLIKLFIIILISFLSGMILYIFIGTDKEFLLQRMKKGTAIAKKRAITEDILELLKPIAVLNVKNSQNTKNEIKKLFVKLGMPANDADIMEFENKRLFGVIMFSVFGIMLAFSGAYITPEPHLKVIAAGTCFCLPIYFKYKSPVWLLQKKVKIKEKAFEKFFPDAIDMMCVCVEAGLGLDAAIERVGREFGNFSKEVGAEFSRMAKDMLSGMSKQDTFKGLAERIENKDIQSFVAVIIQADKMGASISNSLSISADSLRTKRKQRIEALVLSASTKMTLPLVLFLLPATFVVILTPAIIQIMKDLGGASFGG